MPINQQLREKYAAVGVTDEHFAKLEEVFTDDELQTKLAAGYMKDADYTAKTQALAVERKQLEDDREALSREHDDILTRTTTHTTDIEGRLNKALEDASKANLYGAALENKMRMLAAQYGEDPDLLLKDVLQKRAEPEPKKPETPAFDADVFKKDFVSRKEYEDAVSAVALFPIEFDDIRRDYRNLSGKDIDGRGRDLAVEAYKEVAARRQKGEQINFRQYMEEKLDFNGLREANTKAEREKWEADTKVEIEKNVRSEYLASNPGAVRQTEQPDEWRQKLDAKSRAERQPARNTAAEDFKRRQELHRDYEERAAKRQEGAVA